MTKLANGFCAENYASAPGGQHYTGVHSDANGNILWPPQNGYAGGFTQAAYLWGDSRFAHQFASGLGVFGQSPPGQLTGWGTPTGFSVQSSFPGASATLGQTSAAVAQIIVHLKALGFFGA